MKDESNGTPAPVNPAPSTTPAITPEQEAELEKLKIERLKLEQEVEAERSTAAAAQKENARLKASDSFTAALEEAGIKFHSNELVRQLAESELHLTFNEDGEPSALVNGKRTFDLVEVIRTVAKNKPFLIADKRTARGVLESQEHETVKSKSEMTQAEKIEFLKTHSLEDWERLPARPMRTVKVQFKEDYALLPMSAKLKLIEEHGADFYATLPNRPKGVIAQQLRGF